MTPDKAKQLLDNATSGPWQSRGDGPSSGKPHLYVCTCEDRTEVAEAVGWDDAPLIAAAPELAELVAGLRYEYAVQVPVNGHWEYTKDDQYGPEVLRNPRDATWYSSRHAAKTWADLWDDGEESPRIVRRLVSEEEVVS